MTKKILISDPLAEEGIEILKAETALFSEDNVDF